MSLVNATSPPERDTIAYAIERRAAVLARLVLAPTEGNPPWVPVLRAIKQTRPWWESISLPDLL